MDRQQDFQLDVAGYLIVRNVLTAEDIEQHLAGLEAEDDVATAALCEHPTLQVYLQQLCGPNHALSGVTGLLPTTTDPDSLAGGGHEPLDWSLAYQKQGDVRFCQSLVVIWALADVAAGDGGFIIVPASHNSQVEVPASLRSGDDSMGLIVQPTLEAGDLLLCVGATLHGTRVWRGQGPQKLFTCTVVAEEVRRPVAAAVAAAPWMAELTPAQ